MTLLGDRRFWPVFWTQFSVAFNDKLFTAGLVYIVTYGDRVFGEQVRLFGMDENMLNPVSNLLLIAPFVLFSAIAGQISDRFSKTKVVRWVKFVEIGVMLAAAAGFAIAAMGDPNTGAMVLLGLVFFMGLQSAFFGPSKYAILPQLLDDDAELVAGNALIEMGTYFSILGAIALATLLIELDNGMWYFCGAVVLIAVLGWLVSLFILPTEAQEPTLAISKEPFSSTWQAARILFKNNAIFQSVLGISWFWALGGAILVIFATYAKGVLHGGPAVYAMMMGLFAVGIGVGSIVCERLSRGRLEIGLVPIGSFGLCVGLAGLWLVGEPWVAEAELLGLYDVAVRWQFWLISVFVLVMAGAGGFFMVPLYTLVQTRSEPTERSRVIGANNIVNSFLILVLQGGLMGFALLYTWMSVDMAWTWLPRQEPLAFMVLAIINLMVAIYIYKQVPEFTLRFLGWMLSNIMYRLRIEGIDNIPERGGVLVVCNHVSFIDFLIVGGAIRRPARFVMDQAMSKVPVASTIFRHAKVIPITSYKKDPELVKRAMDKISEELRAGQLVCIFPEGALPWDEEELEFKKGVEHILARDPVPVVPMALNGLWGSFFSRKDGKAMSKPLRRGAFSPIWLTVEPPIPAEGATAESLQQAVRTIWKRRLDRP
ncbi:MAG: 1-acyl-sn-glycerol-3-phosphate acyltransferase [Kiritimatiellia bacterium]|jgi:1-acyl-sn-glycerol-3-phosphate acyltransferase